MEHRVVVRFGVLVATAVGAVALAVHLGSTHAGSREDAAGAPAPLTVSSAPVGPAGPARPAGRAPRPADARTRLQAAQPRRLGTQRPVDESLPHVHVVDPQTGGLVSVAGAKGLAVRGIAFGPIHADPMPAGVRRSDPTDTHSLLERAAVEASGDGPVTAGATAPVGTPGIRTLSKHVVPSCSGTGTDGNRVQVLYVHEADTASRYTQVLPILRNEVANVDDVFALSAEQTGGERRVRWVHDATCLPVIKNVTVPDGALGSSFTRTINAVEALGYSSPARKYLMFADANALCGIGTYYEDERTTGNANDGLHASYARVDTNCWSADHSVAAHELTHTLGGVLPGAPHATTYGHCYDESDIMCYDDGSGIAMRKVCANAQEQLLDCNHDDYFNTRPAAGSFLARSWNTARSSFLDAVVRTPSVSDVKVSVDHPDARTGDTVTFSATSAKQVTWTWSVPSAAAACTFTPGTTGRATLVCPAPVTGPIAVTAHATEASTGAVGSGSATVRLTRAAAPTAVVTAPADVPAGSAFPVSVSAHGGAPLRYAWQAGDCTVAAPADAATTVTCPADVPRDLTLTAVVTQPDGQAVRATATVAVSGTGEEAPAAPSVTTSWSGVRVHGRVIAGRLLAGADTLAGRPVSVRARWLGASAWTTLQELRTGPGGGVASVRVPERAGSLRLVFGGDDTYRSSSSTPVWVRVGTRWATARPSRHRFAGTLRTVGGTRVRHVTVTLQRRPRGSSHWATVARVRTDARGHVVHRVSPRRTTYFRWVYLGGSGRTGARSAVLRIR